MNSQSQGKRIRDAAATQAKILAAAKKEFAANGLGGARVDDIAEAAGANKRMIYHYFGSKDDLFKAVLEAAYIDIRNAEANLELDKLAPEEALVALVTFTWQYYLSNPEFLTLVNSANLHEARHLKDSESLPKITQRYVSLVGGILDRGVQDGVFRPGVDPIQLNITIAAISYYYLTNRHTGSVIYEMEFTSSEALKSRLEFNLETILRMVSI